MRVCVCVCVLWEIVEKQYADADKRAFHCTAVDEYTSYYKPPYYIYHTLYSVHSSLIVTYVDADADVDVDVDVDVDSIPQERRWDTSISTFTLNPQQMTALALTDLALDRSCPCNSGTHTDSSDSSDRTLLATSFSYFILYI